MERNLLLTMYKIFIIVSIINRAASAGPAVDDCTCFDCLKVNICPVVKLKIDGTKLFARQLLDQQLINLDEYSSIGVNVSYQNAACVTNKVAYVVAYLYDLPLPTPSSVCESPSCGSDSCFQNLQNFDQWTLLKENCQSENKQIINKRLFGDVIATAKHILTYNSSTIKFDNFTKEIKKTFAASPIQKELTTVDKFNIVLKILSEFLQCNKDNPVDVLHHVEKTIECDEFADRVQIDVPSDFSFDQQTKMIGGGGPATVHENEFLSNPASFISEYLSEKLSLLTRINMVITSYKTPVPCVDVFKHKKILEENQNKLPDEVMFLDELLINKIKLATNIPKLFLGCNNCANERDTDIENCGLYDIVRTIGKFQAKQKMLKLMFEEVTQCDPTDHNCIEHSMRDRHEDAMRSLLDLSKEAIGCNQCSDINSLKCANSSNCERTLVLPIATKYGAIRELFTRLAGCKQAKDQFIESIQANNNNDALMGEMFEEIAVLFQLVVKLTKYEEQATADLYEDVKHVERVVQEHDCVTIEQLGSYQCEPYLVKLKLKVYHRVLATVLNCQTESISAGITICKSNSFDDFNTGDCSSQQMEMQKVMILTSIFFPECINDLFQKTLLECSSQAVYLNHRDKLFGEVRILEEMYKMKETPEMSDIFKEDNIAIEMIEKLFKINKCTERCPNFYKYCSRMRECILEWEECNNAQSMDTPHVMLPLVYSANTTSESFSVRQLSQSDISIYHRHDNNTSEETGTWQYELDGRWHDINKLPQRSSIKIGQSNKVRYRQAKLDYGLKVLHYYDDATEKLIGERTNVADVFQMKLALLMIHPTSIATNFTVHMASNATIFTNEDENDFEGALDISSIVHIHTPAILVTDPIPHNYHHLVPTEDLRLFEQSVALFKQSRPFLKFNTDVSSYGQVIVLARDKEHVQTTVGNDNQYISLDLEGKLAFLPKSNYNGNFTAQVEICNCYSQDKMSKIISISFVVWPVNDMPYYPSTLAYLPPIAFNLTDEPYNGFTIDQLIHETKAHDIESGKNIQIAIYQTSADKTVGTWQYYSTDENTWYELSVQNQMNIHDPVNQKGYDTIQVHIFNGSERLRFHLTNTTRQWPFYEAMKRSFFGFFFYDKADGNLNLGTNYVTMHSIFLSPYNAYSQPIIAVQLRRGCDDKAGSIAKYDTCGICGGNGKKCLGCDGVKYSGALLDHCGICTGGNTNKLFNFMKDCAGTCGQSSKDECNRCQISNSQFRRNFKDCNGECFGKARKDRCGVCWGGEAERKIPNINLDSCGVCFGNGSTCVGCDGIINSSFKRDLCGNCLHPNDKEFNARCLRILTISPETAPVAGGEEIQVNGAGFVTEDISCSFTNETLGEQYSLEMVQGSRSTSSFKLITPSMTRGYYAFQCWVGDNSKYQLENVNFYVYPDTKMKLTLLLPHRIATDRQMVVVVKGSGFQQTGEGKCIVLDGMNVYQFPSAVIDSSKMICHLEAINKSMNARLAISLTKRKWSKLLLTQLPSLPIVIYSSEPLLLFAKISDGYRSVVLTFSKPAQCARNKCQGLFSTNNLKALGDKYKINFKDPTKMQINLGWKATIKPGDRLTLQSESIQPKNEKIFSYTPSTEVILLPPTKALVLKPVVTTLRYIGLCDPLFISAKNSEGGGRFPLVFNWGVDFSSDTDFGALTITQNDSLIQIKNKLKSLPPNKNHLKFKFTQISLEAGLNYEFKLNITNFLDEESHEVSQIVTRKGDITPRVQVSGGLMRNLKAGRFNKIQAKARIPKCSGASSTRSALLFSWEIDNPDVTLDERSRNKSVLFIRPGTLMGGETYVLTLTVSFKNNPLAMTQVSITLNILAEQLLPKIRGGNRVVSKDDDIRLDATKSRDPAKTKETARFEWECYDKNDVACFVQDVNNTDQYVRYKLPSQSKVTIRNNTLNANETYKFKLHYHKGTRVNIKETNIKILATKPPKVAIRPQKKQKENIGKAIKIKSYVKSKASSVKIWLELVEDDGFGYINLTDPNVLVTPLEMSKNKAGVFPFDIVFNKDVFDGGIIYKFRVYAQSGNETGYADTLITTNTAPAVGLLLVDESNGTALTTVFTLEAEGWEDEADDLPLSYVFGYYSNNGHKHYLQAPSASNLIETTLPSGDPNDSNNLHVFVEARDIYGAASELALLVTVQPLDNLDVDLIYNMSSIINEAVESDDMSSLLGTIASTLAVFEVVKDDSNENKTESEQDDQLDMKSKLQEFKENSTKVVLQLIDEVEDTETQNIIIKNLRDMTSEGDKFDDSVKENLANKMAEIVKKQVFSGEGSKDEKRKRRRREVEDEDASTNGKTVEEVEDILTSYTNIVTPSDYSNSSMRTKKTFTELSTTLLAGLCYNAAFGEDGAPAKSNLANLQVLKNSFSNVDTLPFTLGCRGGNCTTPSEVVLGEHLQTLYKSWSCESDEECAGACIGSAIYPDDIFTSNATEKDRVSHVVSVEMFNPNTNEKLFTGVLNSRVEFHIPFINETQAEYQYECQMWDESNERWSSDDCYSSNSTKQIYGSPHGVCQCVTLGIVSLGKPAKLAFANAVVERDEPSRYAKIEISFVESLENIMTKSGAAYTEETIKSSLVQEIAVDDWRVRNVTTLDNYKVQFEFLPPDEDVHDNALITFDAQLSTIEEIVTNGTFTVEFIDDTSVTIDSSYFVKTIIISASKTSSTGEEEETSSLLPVYIAIGVIGGILIISIAVGVIIKYKLVSSTYVV